MFCLSAAKLHGGNIAGYSFVFSAAESLKVCWLAELLCLFLEIGTVFPTFSGLFFFFFFLLDAQMYILSLIGNRGK